jgi:hypothetical protein
MVKYGKKKFSANKKLLTLPRSYDKIFLDDEMIAIKMEK